MWKLLAELSCSVHPGLSLLHEFILGNAFVSEKVGKIVILRNMMSGHAGHGGNPGKFEPCRRFEVGFHPCSSRDENSCALHGESYNEVRIFTPGRARHVNACVCVYVYGPS